MQEEEGARSRSLAPAYRAAGLQTQGERRPVGWRSDRSAPRFMVALPPRSALSANGT